MQSRKIDQVADKVIDKDKFTFFMNEKLDPKDRKIIKWLNKEL